MNLRRLLDRPCPFHDRALPRKIAELEEATGINPNALAELRASSDLVTFYADPDLIDCGNRRCRERRRLAP